MLVPSRRGSRPGGSPGSTCGAAEPDANIVITATAGPAFAERAPGWVPEHERDHESAALLADDRFDEELGRRVGAGLLESLQGRFDHRFTRGAALRSRPRQLEWRPDR